jgi:D-3-phosphoglycerate dehydrogenase
MTRVVIPDDDPVTVAVSAAFAQLAEFDVRTYSTRPKSPQEMVERIRDADIVINVRATSPFSKDVLHECPKLRLISIWGTGTDNVDLELARAMGIRVTNTPGVAAAGVAEHALMLMLAVSRRIVEIDHAVRSGKWPKAMGTSLNGKTLGVIGTGAIGKALIRLGKGIGMNVVAWSFHPKDPDIEWVSFEAVFHLSDVVSVHVRQSPESIGLISRDQLMLMKPSAIFINTSRGAIIDEQDLIEALETNSIAGAGLDVFQTEPPPVSSRLLSLSNVVLTPHAAGTTPEIVEAGIALAIRNISEFLRGQPQNVVV